MAVTALMYFAIISHLVHTEPVVKTEKPVIFAKVKDWAGTFKGTKAKYFEHLYNSSK
jgi:hypothetical protein